MTTSNFIKRGVRQSFVLSLLLYSMYSKQIFLKAVHRMESRLTANYWTSDMQTIRQYFQIDLKVYSARWNKSQRESNALGLKLNTAKKTFFKMQTFLCEGSLNLRCGGSTVSRTQEVFLAEEHKRLDRAGFTPFIQSNTKQGEFVLIVTNP